jgi:hypothetical protein
MSDSGDERRQEFDSPSFNRGFLSDRWFEANKQDIYQRSIDLAWEELLAEDDWYAWLKLHGASIATLDNAVWFEDGRELSLEEAPGKSGVVMRVPSEVFGRETGAIDLMRAVIVLLYGKAADVLGIERPPDFGIRADVLKEPRGT